MKPMLLGTSLPFDNPDWIFELKLDGFRAIIYIEEDVKILSRSGRDITNDYPELQKLKAAPCILDGEIIALSGDRPDFGKLMRKDGTVQFVAFDILRLDGRDLTCLPLTERKKILAGTIKETDRLVVCRYVDTCGIALFQEACARNLEGIVAKRKASIYVPGKRTRDWLKIKCLSHEEYLKRGRGIT